MILSCLKQPISCILYRLVCLFFCIYSLIEEQDLAGSFCSFPTLYFSGSKSLHFCSTNLLYYCQILNSLPGEEELKFFVRLLSLNIKNLFISSNQFTPHLRALEIKSNLKFGF